MERVERYRVIEGECWETTLSPNKIYPQLKIAGAQTAISVILRAYGVSRGKNTSFNKATKKKATNPK